MEAVILVGIPGSGKSTFCRQRFYNTHIRLNLDMLRTRRRERMLLEACIAVKQSFVVDNTNTTRAERALYVRLARPAGFALHAYYFDAPVEQCAQRNMLRTGKQQVPAVAIRAMAHRMESPELVEGFDQIWRVRIGEAGEFVVE